MENIRNENTEFWWATAHVAKWVTDDRLKTGERIREDEKYVGLVQLTSA